MNSPASPLRSRSSRGRLWRWLGWGVLGLGVILATGAVGMWVALRGSLAALDGETALGGLSAPTRIERDALGVPTVRASNRVDAARALGFLHAQERFFQMDLLRRRGAGELAGLFGPALVDHDSWVRRHGLRAVARASLEQMPARHRELLEAYVAGVNGGLSALGARPPEYLLLGVRPAPWRAEDSLLVGAAMFFSLQDDRGSNDRRRGAVSRALPAAVEAFFFPDASAWDAPLDGTELPESAIPGPEAMNFAEGSVAAAVRLARAEETAGGGWVGPRRDQAAGEGSEGGWVPGSNSWGVGGEHSGTGSAMVADDMHLDLAVPNTWFRVMLRWRDETAAEAWVVGVSLPGVPAVIVGSNGSIAWAFTNAEVDTVDVVVLETDPADADRYRTPEGWRSFEVAEENLEVRGEAPRVLKFQRTLWGPVLPDEPTGLRYAARWVVHQAGALNLRLLDLENVRDAASALALAPECGVPVQNFLVGDREGSLGWTLIGRLPKRVGFDGRRPVSWADGGCRWDGWVAPADYPRFGPSKGGRLWTANNRILGSPEYLRLGPWSTDMGARARQIRDGLEVIARPVTELDLMRLQGDDRALFLTRWRDLLKNVLASSDPKNPRAAGWSAMLTEVEDWGGRAATNSVGYRLVRGFRGKVMQRLLEPVLARCRELDRAVDYGVGRQEGPAWTLLQKRPGHLLNPRFPTYDALLADAVDNLLEDLERQNLSVSAATWGERNQVRVQHPLSGAVPWLGRWLDMPVAPLPGDLHMPRVQGPRMGASQRLVVSPGHEASGLFHMPGGQSGHFLSPHYRAGHRAWERLEPQPLLPGAARHQLTLRPGAGRGRVAGGP